MPDALVLTQMYSRLARPRRTSVAKRPEVVRVARIELIMPDLVVHESINLRSASYVQAATRFVDAFGEIEKFFEIEPIYVPDVSEIREVLGG